jgi:hypothetical protein
VEENECEVGDATDEPGIFEAAADTGLAGAFLTPGFYKLAGEERERICVICGFELYCCGSIFKEWCDVGASVRYESLAMRERARTDTQTDRWARTV